MSISWVSKSFDGRTKNRLGRRLLSYIRYETHHSLLFIYKKKGWFYTWGLIYQQLFGICVVAWKLSFESSPLFFRLVGGPKLVVYKTQFLKITSEIRNFWNLTVPNRISSKIRMDHAFFFFFFENVQKRRARLWMKQGRAQTALSRKSILLIN